MTRRTRGSCGPTADGTVRALPDRWWQLASIISCGTPAAALIPEFTEVFTSSHSRHVHEIVTASREEGASLTILSGMVAGSFSAFWKGMLTGGPASASRRLARGPGCGVLVRRTNHFEPIPATTTLTRSLNRWDF